MYLMVSGPWSNDFHLGVSTNIGQMNFLITENVIQILDEHNPCVQHVGTN